MHLEVETFLTEVAAPFLLGSDAPPVLDVVEVGSLDVNGNAQTFLPGVTARTWVGIDYIDGPGVDIVGDAVDVLQGLRGAARPTVIVSTEALEHCRDWDYLVAVMALTLKPGGVLILTCAGTGRPPHAADGSGPPRPGEHYRNVSLDEVARWAGLHGVKQMFGREAPPGDTQYIGRKTK